MPRTLHFVESALELRDRIGKKVPICGDRGLA